MGINMLGILVSYVGSLRRKNATQLNHLRTAALRVDPHSGAPFPHFSLNINDGLQRESMHLETIDASLSEKILFALSCIRRRFLCLALDVALFREASRPNSGPTALDSPFSMER